jgi:hypothetical protein
LQSRKRHRPKRPAAKIALGDDAHKLASLLSVGRNRFVGFEVAIALDAEAALAADCCEFGERNVSKLWATESEIAEAEG